MYYSKADANGIGFDRTASGTDAIAQYAPEVQAQFGDPHALDEKYMLWFHHEPWDMVFPPAKRSGIRLSSTMISALRRWPGCNRHGSA